MSFARIVAAEHAVPARVVENEELTTFMDTSDEWIRSRTGIERRHISENQQTSDLAAEVVEKLLATAQLSADSLDFIIIATVTPDSTMPSTAALVQAKVGATHAFAFDIAAACSGFVYALSVADKLLSAGTAARGVVIGAEVFSKILDWSDRTTAVLFGDGAAGVLLDNEGMRPMILSEKLQTDGSRGASLESGLTGLASPFSEDVADKKQLTMEGRAIFDFAVRDVPKNIAATIENVQLTADKIDFFLLHQANARLLDAIAKKLKLPREKFLQNLQNYGNTSAASIPLLLSESLKNGTITLGSSQKIALTGFGGGLTWGTLIVNI